MKGCWPCVQMKEPFVLSRSGYAGIQSMPPFGWRQHVMVATSGPQHTDAYQHGLSGVAFAGVDIGGFGFDCTGELLSRWYAVGIFYPYFRNHCWMKGPVKSPGIGEQVEGYCPQIHRDTISALPYIYSCSGTICAQGRPCFARFPDVSRRRIRLRSRRSIPLWRPHSCGAHPGAGTQA